MSSVVTGKSQIYIGTITPSINLNNPTVPETAGKFVGLPAISADMIPELKQRAGVYTSFRIKKIEMIFQRDSSKVNNFIASASFNGQGNDNYVVIPNYHSINRPTPSATNTRAVYTWCCNQPGAKKIGLDVMKFKKTLRPILLEQREYIGTQPIPALTARNAPWMEFQSDIADKFFFGSCVMFAPCLDVQTIGAVATTAASPGMNAANIDEHFRWHQSVRVTWQVRGRGPVAALAV